MAWPRWRQFLGHLGSLFAPLRYGPAPDIESFAASLPGSQDAALVRALAGQDVDEVVDDFFESPWMRAELAGYGPFLYSGGSALGIAWAAMFTGGSLAQGYPRGGMGRSPKPSVEVRWPPG